jgi:DNA-binding MarR family transcriptional regulator
VAALVHLERSAGAMRQKDLALALALDSSSIVRLIDGLQAQGWVERIDDADRRVKRIQLTAAGLLQVETVKTIVADVRSEVMQELPPICWMPHWMHWKPCWKRWLPGSERQRGLPARKLN